MKEDELKPCPFCGGKGYEEKRQHLPPDKYEWAYYIYCNSCGCEGPWSVNKGHARWLWNHRTGEDTDAR